nr:MAG TPA: hypothetical protein [Caudoviricetes sp.]
MRSLLMVLPSRKAAATAGNFSVHNTEEHLRFGCRPGGLGNEPVAR